MADAVQEGGYGERFFLDVNTRIRDIEEKQRLLRDKMLLIGDSFVKERDKNFDEMQEMKKVVEMLDADVKRMKEVLVRLGEGLDKSASRDELMILQKQFDLFRES